MALRDGPKDIVTETARTLGQASPPLLTLRLLYSGEAGLITRPGDLLLPGATPIGRAVESGLALPADRRASRHHATVVVSAGDGATVQVVDQDSKNGVFVNGQRRREATLSNGDILRIGDSLFILRLEPVETAVDQPLPGLVGISPAMRGLRRQLLKLARSPGAVLLQGETGTGKDVCAQALHRSSERAARPLVVLDGGAVARNLIESELFGHEPGAFTGAQKTRIGLFEQASGGTLFIDELGELPLELQPMLLRALEQGTIRRVGGNAPLKVDVRIIAATNRDLLREIKEQRFRADLYARLAQSVISLPPLRTRREDILPLFAHALAPMAPKLTPDLAEALVLHPWPFNVREIAAVAAECRLAASDRDPQAPLELGPIATRLQASALLDPGAPLSETPRHPTRATVASKESPPAPSPSRPATDFLRKFETPTHDELTRLLAESGGVISVVARQLGCSRKQVYRWMAELGLSLDAYRAARGEIDPADAEGVE